MKLRMLAGCLGAGALVAGGAWTWDRVRHARLDLVTLHVTDAPLGEVLGRIESQTRETVVADARFTTNTQLRVHLDLEAAPLAEALARVAEQAGGFTRTTYAVHRAPGARSRLEALLRAGGDPLGAGWTSLPEDPPPVPLPAPGSEPVRLPLGSAPPPDGGRVLVIEDDVRPGGPGSPGGPPGSFPPAAGMGELVIEGGPGAPGVPRTGPGPGPRGFRRVIVRNGNGAEGHQTIDVSPERVLLEAGLRPRVADPALLAEASPTPEYARRLAGALGGDWSVLHTLEALPFGGFPAGEQTRISVGEAGSVIPVPGGGRWNGSGERRPAHPGELLSRAESELRRGRFDRLERLSPEQRARQASEARSTSVQERTEGGVE